MTTDISSDEDGDVPTRQQQQKQKQQARQKNGKAAGKNGRGKPADDQPQRRKGGEKAWETSLKEDNIADRLKKGTTTADLVGVAEAQAEAKKRERLRADTQPFQRGIIRHVVLAIDITEPMAERDMPPSRFLVQLRLVNEFVTEFFEQNPISQLSILGMHEGVSVVISEPSGKPDDHLANLAMVKAGSVMAAGGTATLPPAVNAAATSRKLVPREPKGSASLQNVLEMARVQLHHTPSYGTREAVIILGGLLSVDPGDIHKTIKECARDRVKVSIIGLGARVKICSEICARTNSGDDSSYDVAADQYDLKDKLMRLTAPPLMRSKRKRGPDGIPGSAVLLQMGFPSRIGITAKSGVVGGESELDRGGGSGAEEALATTTSTPTICACHGAPSREGYVCPRCKVKVCTLPVSCPCCSLTLVQSSHLARSYHHLFPLQNFSAATWPRALEKGAEECAGCLQPFPAAPAAVRRAWEGRRRARRAKKGRRHLVDEDDEDDEDEGEGEDGKEDRELEREGEGDDAGAARMARVVELEASESSRYECLRCGLFFCVDCDVFCHDVLHNCPGCLGLKV